VKSLLLILARNPELGQVKTRLAKGIGEQKALEVYRQLLHHTCAVTQPLAVAKQVYYSRFIPEKDLWTEAGFEQRQQVGEDLGERMKNAFSEAFGEGYKQVVMIGTDLLDLRQHHLAEAFQHLQTQPAVLGPAEDGGFYLLGLRNMLPSLFVDQQWGSDQVLATTRKCLAEAGLSWQELESLNDIDTPADYYRSDWSAIPSSL